jgi:hypothetical protein
MLKRMILKMFDALGYEILLKRSRRSLRFWPDHVESPQTIYETDKWFNRLYEEAQVRTQMEASDNPLRRQRHYTLNYLVAGADLGLGDVCELGCWRGLSAYQIATRVRESGCRTTFHVFDSFEGLSQIKDEDVLKAGGQPQNIDAWRKSFACPLETVRRNLSEFDFIRYYRGWIPERFGEVADRTFSLVHIDVDLYQPIRDSFEFFYPRLVPGGIIIFDDYGCVAFPGAKKAVDECLEKFGRPFFVPLPSGQAFLLKPALAGAR